jgi:hypothetical protein
LTQNPGSLQQKKRVDPGSSRQSPRNTVFRVFDATAACWAHSHAVRTGSDDPSIDSTDLETPPIRVWRGLRRNISKTPKNLSTALMNPPIADAGSSGRTLSPSDRRSPRPSPRPRRSPRPPRESGTAAKGSADGEARRTSRRCPWKPPHESRRALRSPRSRRRLGGLRPCRTPAASACHTNRHKD